MCGEARRLDPDRPGPGQHPVIASAAGVHPVSGTGLRVVGPIPGAARPAGQPRSSGGVSGPPHQGCGLRAPEPTYLGNHGVRKLRRINLCAGCQGPIDLAPVRSGGKQEKPNGDEDSEGPQPLRPGRPGKPVRMSRACHGPAKLAAGEQRRAGSRGHPGSLRRDGCPAPLTRFSGSRPFRPARMRRPSSCPSSIPRLSRSTSWLSRPPVCDPA